MEISDENALGGSDGMYLTMAYAKHVPADGTVRECRCSCLHERGDWDYYQLKCGHYFHTRCLKHWLDHKGKLNCPLCGDIPEINNNQYCSHCKEWGHFGDDVCPIIKEIIKGFLKKC